MKKALFFLLFIVSINVFAQSKRPGFNAQHPALNSIKNVEGILTYTRSKTYNNYSGINARQIVKPYTSEHPSLIQIYDSIYVWELDVLSAKWKIAYKTIDLVYDTKNNLTNYIQQKWNGSVWENSHQITSTYDANNNEINYIEQDWNGSAWVNQRQKTCTFDANDNRTSRLEQGWNSGVWENSYRVTYTYDVNNNQTNDLGQIWNGNAWENFYQDNYTYDTNNNLASILGQSWNGNTWENASQSIYSFVNNNLTSSLGQTWNGSAWENFSQSSYVYDANNNLTSIIGQDWNGSVWENSYQLRYTYDTNNFTQSETFQRWNNTGTEIEYGDSTYYYFHTVVGVNDLIRQEWNIALYPNPALEYVVIEGACPGNAKIQLEIYDITGRELRREMFSAYGSFSKEINISALPAGEYQVALSGEGNRRKQMKFLKY